MRDALGSLPIFKAGMLEIVALVPLEPYAGFAPPNSPDRLKRAFDGAGRRIFLIPRRAVRKVVH